VWVVAWVLALAGVHASGYHASQGFSINALRWMFYLPAGWMFIVSGLMHTKYAKKTAELIGWRTKGFRYELGFVSFGLGLAGIYASLHGTQAWITMANLDVLGLCRGEPRRRDDPRPQLQSRLHLRLHQRLRYPGVVVGVAPRLSHRVSAARAALVAARRQTASSSATLSWKRPGSSRGVPPRA